MPFVQPLPGSSSRIVGAKKWVRERRPGHPGPYYTRYDFAVYPYNLNTVPRREGSEMDEQLKRLERLRDHDLLLAHLNGHEFPPGNEYGFDTRVGVEELARLGMQIKRKPWEASERDLDERRQGRQRRERGWSSRGWRDFWSWDGRRRWDVPVQRYPDAALWL
ncbi:hypothetical protein BT69DRAFT_1397891 [Atractiella rhizophila]|nr:hypothetical protein BT69DRAFT_1397891 [Atractiella rhizophila]